MDYCWRQDGNNTPGSQMRHSGPKMKHDKIIDMPASTWSCGLQMAATT